MLRAPAHFLCPPSKQPAKQAAGTHGELEGLEQQLVSQHVHSQLLITEGVDAGGGSAGGSADLQRIAGGIRLVEPLLLMLCMA
jgi:hypothetical protein